MPKAEAGNPTATTGTAVRNMGLGRAVTVLFESIGLLNKGSADWPPTPDAAQAAQTAGISNNALNVTRVGGLAALITGAGAAALTLFNVNKGTDKASIVVAAYVSVGAIVAAALLTSAIIISADIRSRTALNEPAAPAAGSAGSTGPAAHPADGGNQFHLSWYQALSILNDAVHQLEQTPHDPPGKWIAVVTQASIDASGSSGMTANLRPADDGQATLHARLTCGQSIVLSQFGKLVDAADPAQTATALNIIRPALGSMAGDLPWP